MTQSNDDPSRAGDASVPGSPATAVRWNQSDSHTIHPTFFDASATREEVALLFGRERSADAANPEPTIDLTDRVILSPSVAKQIAAALNTVIVEYEAKFGPLRPGGIAKTPYELSARLLQDIKSFNAPTESEQSFKMVRERILKNRFLTWISKSNLANADERILEVCARIGMPENLQEILKSKVAETNFVHFGFEEDQGACLYKVYLEFLDEVRKQIDNNREKRSPILLHLAFKWDAIDHAKQAVTSYTLHPWISISEMIFRASGTLASTEEREGAGIVEEIIRLASARVPPHDLLYLEVTEPGNPRRSFDINMYRANLKVSELQPYLDKIAHRLNINDKNFHELYDGIKDQRFGHLAGGSDRNGREFFTVYYGASRFQRIEPQSSEPVAFSRPPPVELRRSGRRTIPPLAETPLVMKLVQNLDAPFGVERSFRVFERTLITDRVLLPLRRNASPGQDERTLDICRRLRMPADFVEAYKRNLPNANILLFGQEGDSADRIYNADLEFSQKLSEVTPGDPEVSEPFPIQISFQWNQRRESHNTRTGYTCFPLLSLDEIVSRLTVVFDAQAARPFRRIMEELLAVADRSAKPGSLLYCEATKGENPRPSFDVNVYRANLSMEKIYPSLLAVVRHFSSPVDAFESLYREIKGMVFGHFTCGIDLDGRDFMTFYFSEKGSPG